LIHQGIHIWPENSTELYDLCVMNLENFHCARPAAVHILFATSGRPVFSTKISATRSQMCTI
jgi:hypothetical protein